MNKNLGMLNSPLCRCDRIGARGTAQTDTMRNFGNERNRRVRERGNLEGVCQREPDGARPVCLAAAYRFTRKR